MKVWKACLFALWAAIVSAAITDARQAEAFKAGDRVGNRCFNGKYWKNCGEPDAPPPVFAPQPNTWQFVQCYTNDCIASTLNGLTWERAAEAKLTTWKDSTFVWFR